MGMSSTEMPSMATQLEELTVHMARSKELLSKMDQFAQMDVEYAHKTQDINNRMAALVEGEESIRLQQTMMAQKWNELNAREEELKAKESALSERESKYASEMAQFSEHEQRVAASEKALQQNLEVYRRDMATLEKEQSALKGAKERWETARVGLEKKQKAYEQNSQEIAAQRKVLQQLCKSS